ncbi:carbohydrate esterase family 5 protein [Hyaloscypha variabilis F]|uniref:Carbohydrate esterase family 5 protein n=1 Tax=Hyaloscypha variabilis (strain UAMH 11265 / GT02V1 / F) TaxID=1149755 RepID=A0A2J6RWS5_HYAVF|nr:carbohydrate esterase family 5 protein [Hyaloscypha variabilis F]
MLSQATLLLLIAGASASPMLSDTLILLESRQQSCPNLHVFGARETTVPQGFGSSGSVVDMILAANPGATKEQIFYPATGGDTYGTSARAGVLAVTNQVTNFSTQCPETQIVLVGYSQGAQIMDDAMCGGGDPDEQILNTTAPISATIAARVKAIILMGDPRHTPGAPYNIGNSTEPGFAPRLSGQICTAFASIIQSYCDQADPFCSKGNDPAVHKGYPKEYGAAALAFIQI